VEPTDEALCERVASGDEPAFELLVSRYQERAYRLAWSILRDGEEARDASQEAFVKLYRTAGTFGGRARFSTWFYRLLVNQCLDRQRRLRRWRSLLVRPGSGDETPDEDFLERQPAPITDPLADLGREDVMKRLWAAVEELSPQQRAAVVLQVKDELPTAEIATVLNCSEATVRVHLHRALKTLRRRLESA
jgi:RNA polymerase sigma-70 factor (ECF subfamily)